MIKSENSWIIDGEHPLAALSKCKRSLHFLCDSENLSLKH